MKFNKLFRPIKSIVAASMIQGCIPIPTFQTPNRPEPVQQENLLPSPNGKHLGLESICYRTITESRRQIIHCINTQNNNNTGHYIQNVLREHLSIEAQIEEVNQGSQIYKIKNFDTEKAVDILAIIKNSGYNAYLDFLSETIIFY